MLDKFKISSPRVRGEAELERSHAQNSNHAAGRCNDVDLVALARTRSFDVDRSVRADRNKIAPD